MRSKIEIYTQRTSVSKKKLNDFCSLKVKSSSTESSTMPYSFLIYFMVIHPVVLLFECILLKYEK